jgi:hypothetical protein
MSACFWEDRWSNSVLAISYPRLASFALNNAASIKDILEANNRDFIFILPLSQEALQEFEQLQDSLLALELNENNPDQWKPDWGKDYTAKRFYTMVYDLFQAHPIFKLVWKSRCTPRIKFFIWLVLVDQLNTETMLSRRHIGEKNNDHCVLCNLGENETLEHLFFICPFCRMDLPGPTASVGTRTDYSVGPWDYPACATRHLKAWSTRTAQE